MPLVAVETINKFGPINHSVLLIVFSDNLSAKKSKLSADSGNSGPESLE